MNKENKDNEEIAPSGITRKDAIKKMGKYAALTALGTFMILNPKKAQATSASPPSSPPSSGGGGAGDESGDPPTRGSDNPPSPPGWDD